MMNPISRFGQTSRFLFALVVGALTFLGIQGCVVIATDDGPDHYPSGGGYDYYAPYITSQSVTCNWDGYYQDYYFDFYAWVEDPDYDVVDVYVDIYDPYYDEYVETWDLVYDGGTQWSNRIYETYSYYLDCEYMDTYDYYFWAFDSYGASDSVVVTWAY